MVELVSNRFLIQRAIILLNLQRAQVSGTTIEGDGSHDESVYRWVDSATAAVNARQSVRTLHPKTTEPTLIWLTGGGCFPRTDRNDSQI